MYKKLSFEEERIGKAVVNAAYKVHCELGPGLLERVYEVCFCHVLTESGFQVERQVRVPIKFEDTLLDEKLIIDVLVDELVICELKSVEILHPVYFSQVLSHLTLVSKRLGYLINFNVPLIKNGIHRLIK